MQPKKQLKVQYIGIFEEIDSFYWPKMHFLEKGQKIRAFGQCPKENVFFPLMSSLRNTNVTFDQKVGFSRPKTMATKSSRKV